MSPPIGEHIANAIRTFTVECLQYLGDDVSISWAGGRDAVTATCTFTMHYKGRRVVQRAAYVFGVLQLVDSNAPTAYVRSIAENVCRTLHESARAELNKALP